MQGDWLLPTCPEWTDPVSGIDRGCRRIEDDMPAGFLKLVGTFHLEDRAEILALAITEVALEYGVRVKYIEPEVIVALMHMTQSQSFGVRPERFLIDDMLGSSFAMAAQRSITETVAVIGPPYECVPHEMAEPTDREQEFPEGSVVSERF